MISNWGYVLSVEDFTYARVLSSVPMESPSWRIPWSKRIRLNWTKDSSGVRLLNMPCEEFDLDGMIGMMVVKVEENI